LDSSAIYIVTAGGFIGIASFLPTYLHDQFSVTQVEAGQLTMLATLMSAVARVVGGRVADRPFVREFAPAHRRAGVRRQGAAGGARSARTGRSGR
jgi:MFS family permease